MIRATVAVTKAAEASGVTHQTASEWLNAHSGFRAALNQRRQELWAESADRLRSLQASGSQQETSRTVT